MTFAVILRTVILMSESEDRFDVDTVQRRIGDELGGSEYRCTDCDEVFWSPYASSAIDHCPRCGQSEIDETGLALVGEIEPSQSYKSWKRVQDAIQNKTGGHSDAE